MNLRLDCVHCMCTYLYSLLYGGDLLRGAILARQVVSVLQRVVFLDRPVLRIATPHVRKEWLYGAYLRAYLTKSSPVSIPTRPPKGIVTPLPLSTFGASSSALCILASSAEPLRARLPLLVM